MASPLTEAVLIAAIVAVSIVFVTISYLVFLLRQGKPLNISFRGFGVDLRVGSKHVVSQGGENVASKEK